MIRERTGQIMKTQEIERGSEIVLQDQVRQKYEELTQRLIRKGITITTMESCTAGQIASLITDTEGSSAILKGAFVTYSNGAKILQGEPACEKCTLEMNQGNHFKEPDIRTAKGFAWLLNE